MLRRNVVLWRGIRGETVEERQSDFVSFRFAHPPGWDTVYTVFYTGESARDRSSGVRNRIVVRATSSNESSSSACRADQIVSST